MRWKSRFLIAASVWLSLLSVLSLMAHLGWLPTSSGIFPALRWIGLLALGGYAFERKSLTGWILLALASGIEFGHDSPAVAVHFQLLGTVFLRLIKVILAPLLFATLVVGIAGHGNLRDLGRMALKTIVYFEIVSTLALLIGFAAIHTSRAGYGVEIQASSSRELTRDASHGVTQLITDIFPENIAKSVAENQVLQVVVFSILFGVSLAAVPEAKRRPLLAFAESLSATMFRFTNFVMLAAPLGVFGAVAYTVGHIGLGVLLPLGKLLLTMYLALVVFVAAVLLPIARFARVPLRPFFQAVSEPVALAFGTASSEAALPRAMERMEAMGVRRETVAFVMPTGYTFNLDGSSLYQAVALFFVIQAAGVPVSLGQQAFMLLTLLVSSKGTAGVARASLVVVFATAASFHLPTEPLFLLLGIDQLMDMGRTAVNVLGNCLATVVVARWEGENRL